MTFNFNILLSNCNATMKDNAFKNPLFKFKRHF